MPAYAVVCPDPFHLCLSTASFTPPYALFLGLVAAHRLNSPYSPS